MGSEPNGMSENKTQPTEVAVDEFLTSVSTERAEEARQIIDSMKRVSGFDPVMWGPSIIGFGSQHYKYDTGREGDMPLLGFSPRKTAITIYFSEGFDHYDKELSHLGRYTHSVSCLYIKKLSDIDMNVLEKMLRDSLELNARDSKKLQSVDEYVASIPSTARPQFDALRAIVRAELPNAQEVISYGIIGYKIDKKRARVFISGWKDHVAMYPVPSEPLLQAELKPYIRGKGTLWFSLNEVLPDKLIREAVTNLTLV